MEALDLARWQFGITTVYHFILVPLTIGLAPLVAGFQTAYYRTGKESWLKLTKFFGKLLLINFALGIATGIVQEFQFGMNWSEYSRMVGDIFGAPLAIEALAAFFLESTFLGLWIFGWNRLPKRLHLASIWLAAFGMSLSAYWILTANSFMQHPVGAVFNPETGRAELTDFLAVITNPTAVIAFFHTWFASFLTAGTLVAGISIWWMVRAARKGDKEEAQSIWRRGAMVGLVTTLIAGIGIIGTGDIQGKLMYIDQPMKMSAAEGHYWDNGEPVPFSLLAIGDMNNPESVTHLITIPNLTSWLATGDWNATMPGTEDLQAEYSERYADEFGTDVNYRPDLNVTYWSFRMMIMWAAFSAALAVFGLWALRKRGSITEKKWLARLGIIAIPTPFISNSFGWIFTEMGRQPWVVHPNPLNPVDQVYMLTQNGVSVVVNSTAVLTSMILFTLLYAALGVVWFILMRRYTIEGANNPANETPTVPSEEEAPMSFAY